MSKIDKTVFISYRRKDQAWALNVYKDLKSRQYDVFFDYESIPSGDFEQIIVSNIKARAHFILVLTPTALDRCNESGDWVRREIETAMDERRNIIPLLFDDFSFTLTNVSEKLTGKLSSLKRYNGLEVPATYFDDAMRRLRKKYLNVRLDAVLLPIPDEIQNEVKKHQAAADKALRDGVLEASNRALASLRNETGKRDSAANVLLEAENAPAPGPLLVIPIDELALREEPVVSPDTFIRRIPTTEQLVSVEQPDKARQKVGVDGRWLKVRDESGTEGYVAAWLVKYINNVALDQSTNSGPSKGKKPTRVVAIDDLAFRNQPVISFDSLIRRLGSGAELTIVEPGGESKIGKLNQWLKVEDASGTQGYVAAWYVAPTKID